VIQNHAVEIRAEKAQNHGLFIVDQRGGKRHAHARQGHGPAQLDVQVFVHHLRHDIQPAGGGVSVEEDADADADHQNVAEHIQLLTARYGDEIREQPFKQPQKHRQQHARVNRLLPKFLSAGHKPDDKKHDVQDHRNGRQRERYKIGQHDAEAGDAADGRVARHEEEKDRNRNDGHRHGQNQHFFGDVLAAQLFVHGFGSSQSLFDPSVRSRRQVIAPSSSPRAPARPSPPRGAHRQAPKKRRPFSGSNPFYCIMSKRLCHSKKIRFKQKQRAFSKAADSANHPRRGQSARLRQNRPKHKKLPA